MIDLINNLTKCFAIPGHEDNLRNLIQQMVTPYVTSVKVDRLGNLICERTAQNPAAPTLLLLTHLDAWGLMVTDIDNEGFLRFEVWRKADPYTLIGQGVRFENGTVGVINREKTSEHNPEINDLYIDIGASDKEEALKLVSPGDCAALYGDLHHNFNRLIGKGLSNAAGCAVLLEALKQVPASGFNLYIAFTVQGGLGARGAKVIGNQLSVQAGVSIDITPAADTPKPENLPVKLGKGAGIKVMDKTLLATPVIKRHLVGLAEKKGIPYQYEIHSHWGTDAGIINLSNGGVASGAISLPIRYPFSPMEMIDTRDLKACLDLTVALLEEDFPKA